MRDLDAFRLVCKKFRAGVSRLRDGAPFGLHLLRQACAVVVAQQSRAHEECATFADDDPATYAKKVRERVKGRVKAIALGQTPTERTFGIERSLLVLGVQLRESWDLADRAISWALSRLAPVMHRALWRGAVDIATLDGDTQQMVRMADAIQTRRLSEDAADLRVLIERVCAKSFASPAPEIAAAMAARALGALEADRRPAPAACVHRLFAGTSGGAGVLNMVPKDNPLRRLYHTLGMDSGGIRIPCACHVVAPLEAELAGAIGPEGARAVRDALIRTARAGGDLTGAELPLSAVEALAAALPDDDVAGANPADVLATMARRRTFRFDADTGADATGRTGN